MLNLPRDLVLSFRSTTLLAETDQIFWDIVKSYIRNDLVSGPQAIVDLVKEAMAHFDKHGWVGATP